VNRFFRSAFFPLIVIVCSSGWRPDADGEKSHTLPRTYSDCRR